MKSWLIPCNINYYDVENAYNDLKVLDWKQTVTKIEVGDIVYIYIASPLSLVAYKCEVLNVNKPVPTIDDNKYQIIPNVYANYGRHMELKLIKKIINDKLNYQALRKHGLKGRVQCQRVIGGELEEYIESIFENY